jgi:hypothetical protein
LNPSLMRQSQTCNDPMPSCPGCTSLTAYDISMISRCGKGWPVFFNLLGFAGKSLRI